MSIDRCPKCDNERNNGLCPLCLLQLGIELANPASDKVGDTLDLPRETRSAPELIGSMSGGVPIARFQEKDVVEEPPLTLSTVDESGASTRYRIDDEIGRGGMGIIYRGYDHDLRREVAIKVLREEHRDNVDMVHRFVEEGQIAGQLQHPGIVPIYGLGTSADHRPCFSMKLVRGKTFAHLLTDRPAPADDRPRFLAIFAAVSQAMAYAHTRGVIHRDLKPSNVMVGNFGEVLVMDWGVAKVLPRVRLAEDEKAGKEPPDEGFIATARSDSDEALSQAGTVVGTPNYMAPEQARGETDRIDERADVFALGSILAQILTGEPAFMGRIPKEIRRKAALGDTADVLARLDGCGAETELIALAKDCLGLEPEARPADAGQVADRITAYLASVQIRLQAAERERAVAEAKAIERRRRRKDQLALAASILALAALGGLSSRYYLQQRQIDLEQRQIRKETSDKIISRVQSALDLAAHDPGDPSRWQEALALVEQADASGDEDALDRLPALRRQAEVGLANARKQPRRPLSRDDPMLRYVFGQSGVGRHFGPLGRMGASPIGSLSGRMSTIPGTSEYQDIMQKLRDRGYVASPTASDPLGLDLAPTIRLGPEEYIAAIYRAEVLASFERRLPALLKGEDRPKGVHDQLQIGKMCLDTGRFAAAAKFLGDALVADLELGEDRLSLRVIAAQAAVLASIGRGRDDPSSDDAAKVKLRGQALVWLEAELDKWSRLLESGPIDSRPRIAQSLELWKSSAGLTSIRDREILAKLPEDERKEWQALWAEVDALLARAKGEAAKP
jgi:serine/threonine protein kinase